MRPKQESIRDSLSEHFPSELIECWEGEGIRGLLPIQQKAIEQGCFAGKSLLIVGPTSCGKSFVGEMICAKHSLSLRKCFYLVPFKALAEEKWCELRRRYEDPQIGIPSIISTGDRRDQDRRLVDGDFRIALLTFEKLSTLLVTHPGILTNTGALIVDEIQMVSDDNRGAELELLLTRARQANPDLQIVGLSAVVAELSGFDQWLRVEVVRDDRRPVVLREGVIAPSGRFDYLEGIDSDTRAGTEHFPALDGTSEEDLAVSLVTHLLTDDQQQVLVFASSVAETLDIARRLVGKCSGLRPAASVKSSLAGLEESESTSTLINALDRSIAFHNADLTMEERLAVEQGFRMREIRCLVATSTLSMGVNLPASTVVLIHHEKWGRGASGWQQVPLSIGEYQNMSGRAGRFGLLSDDFGRAILISKSRIEQRALFEKYVQGTPAPLESAFLSQTLDVRVLRVLASRLCNTRKGLVRFLLKMFVATRAWNDAGSQEILNIQIEGILEALEKDGLVVADRTGKLEVTPIGHICASSGLHIATYISLLKFVNSGNCSPVDLALIASQSLEAGPVGLRLATPEYRGRFPVFHRNLTAATEEVPSSNSERFLGDLNPGSLPPYETVKAMKFQAGAVAFISGRAFGLIEDQLGIPAGRCRAIGGVCMWLAETAANLAWIAQREAQAKCFERLSERFLHGCSEEALFLTQVPNRLHRAEREAIAGAGYTSFQLILDTHSEEIASFARVSRVRVRELQEGILKVLGDEIDLHRRQLHRLEALGLAKGAVEALYIASGTALEQAIEDLLRPPFCALAVRRIARQRQGQADLHIILSGGGNGIAQITAKERPTDKVGLVKAGSVLQQSPDLKPEVFICFGRPDFDRDAVEKACLHVEAGRNYKLIPISVLVEMFVRFHEGQLGAERVLEIIEREAGYITVARL
jgi:replicative superfamily II helicase